MTRILCWLLLISPAFILIGCGSSPCSSLIHNNLRSDGIWGRYYATELGGGITGRSHKGDGTLWIDLVPDSMLEMYDHGKLQRRSKFTVRWTEHAGKKRVREIVLPAVGEYNDGQFLLDGNTIDHWYPGVMDAGGATYEKCWE